MRALSVRALCTPVAGLACSWSKTQLSSCSSLPWVRPAPEALYETGQGEEWLRAAGPSASSPSTLTFTMGLTPSTLVRAQRNPSPMRGSECEAEGSERVKLTPLTHAPQDELGDPVQVNFARPGVLVPAGQPLALVYWIGFKRTASDELYHLCALRDWPGRGAHWMATHSQLPCWS